MEFYKAGKSKSGKGREAPPALVANLERAKADQTNLQNELARLDKERVETVARYDVDKARWKRLKSGMVPGTIVDAEGKVILAAPLRPSAKPK